MAIRIVNVRLRFILLMVLVGVVASQWESLMNHYDRWRRAPVTAKAGRPQEIEYYCPMHPSVVREAPGSCPICGMPLSKRAKTGQRTLPQGVLAQVQLSPWKVRIGRIATSPVEYRLLAREVRTVGIVDYDETRRAFIAARVKGRIDQLFVNYVGQKVGKDDPLALIYSPDLLIAQQELLAAVKMREQQKDASEALQASAQAVLASTRKKLILWGLTESQVDDFIRHGTPQTHVTINSPIAGIVTEKNVLEGRYVEEGESLYTVADLSTVWMQARIFEDDIAGIRTGVAAEVTTTAYPNEVFAGRITFVAYTVDPATRTVAARVEIANPEYKLKPGMYASVAIRLPVGEVTLMAPPVPSSGTTESAPSVDTTALARAYLALAAAYSRDETDEAAIANLAREAQRLRDQLTSAGRPEAEAILELTGSLPGQSLHAQRTIFKTIGVKGIDLLGLIPPPEMKLFVVHCPMAEADWLSEAAEVVNPYYGSEMLNCGTVTGPLRRQTPTAAAEVDAERFAVGYYCPVYPDRLYQESHQCPIDKFPLRYAKVEKVLAVPDSAVINTGTRKIVYRESAPGTFDMLGVELGVRAGGYYPVLSGVAEGDQVATAGAFLVDAENRLNPAAGVQYFGATGGPHQH
jgi:RND family efflux transporter MFP subunit